MKEHRSDFVPAIWKPRGNMDLKQVWFIGAHSDVGGSYKQEKDGSALSYIPLKWMVNEAQKAGLSVEDHLTLSIKDNYLATVHKSRRSFYRLKEKYVRPVENEKDKVIIHETVKKKLGCR